MIFRLKMKKNIIFLDGNPHLKIHIKSILDIFFCECPHGINFAMRTRPAQKKFFFGVKMVKQL